MASLVFISTIRAPNLCNILQNIGFALSVSRWWAWKVWNGDDNEGGCSELKIVEGESV